jgi:tetratricopeptide (TPR) repeat protein
VVCVVSLAPREVSAHVGAHGSTAAPSPEAIAAAAKQPTPLLRGKAYYEVGAMADAERELTAAITLEPANAEAFRFRGMVRSHERRFRASFDDFDAALALRPPAPELYNVHYYYGDALFNAGILDRAIARFDALLALHPRHVDAHCYRGEALAKLGKTDLAIAAFRAAIALDSKSAWAHHSLADALAAAGRHDGAVDAFRRDIELVPHCHTARLGLARSLEALGRADEALREYYTSIAYHIGDVDAHVGMGRVFLKKGEAARAYAEFARALEFNARSAEARRGLEDARGRLASWVGQGAASRELTFWRFVGWWLPAVIVAGVFVWRRRRERASR